MQSNKAEEVDLFTINSVNVLSTFIYTPILHILHIIIMF